MAPEEHQAKESSNMELVEYFKVVVRRNSNHITSVEVMDNESKRKEGDNEKEISFGDVSHSWFQLCLGLFEAFPVFRSVAQSFHIHRAESKLVAHLNEASQSIEETKNEENDETTVTYSLSKQSSHFIFNELTILNQYKRAEKAISRAQLLSLISEYEAFVADLLRIIINQNPDAFISKESTIKASEVLKEDSIRDIKSSIIENRIESIQRESHIDQIKLIYDRLKLTPPDTKSIQEFTEICERRNMLTHANGRVSKTYHSKLKNVGYKIGSLPPLGTELWIDTHYMRRSIARVFLMGYFTLHIVWQHTRPDEKDQSIGMMINHSHDFLVSGYTKMAGRVCEFMLNRKSPANELERAFAIINHALSVYLNDEIPEADRALRVEKILAARDWSIVDARFNLALCCLREEYEKIPALIDTCVGEGMTVDAFLTWALFTKVRKQDFFASKMNEHFGVLIPESETLNDPKEVKEGDDG